MNHIYNLAQFGLDFFSYSRLYRDVVKWLPNNSHIIEIGSYKGKSTAFMAVEIINSLKNIRFDCVDTWDGMALSDPSLRESNLFETFINNIKDISYVINPIRSTSFEASKLYSSESLDFIFIDADHEYESVKQDIECWLPKLKKDGIIAGHDYHYTFPGVIKAVNEKFGNSFQTRDDCWIVDKNDNLQRN